MIDFLSHLGTFFLEHLVFAKFHPKVHMWMASTIYNKNSANLKHKYP